MDTRLHDFRNLSATGAPAPDGDHAFDPDEYPEPTTVSWSE
jgi:hypothetical protein